MVGQRGELAGLTIKINWSAFQGKDLVGYLDTETVQVPGKTTVV